jgi:hypothetical protein
MKEKKTFGQFIKDNSGKIKAVLIGAGVIVGGVLIYKTAKGNAAVEKEGLAILDGLKKGFKEAESLGEAAIKE